MTKQTRKQPVQMEEKSNTTFIANCASGLEELVALEIQEFGGAQVVKSAGTVLWQGGLESAYRTCLWSRFSSRVLMKIDSFVIADDDDLYLCCKNIEWDDHLSNQQTFAVTATLGDSPVIGHNHFAALRVKDSVVDYFREKGVQRPSVAKKRPDCKIHLHLHKKEASLYIDFSGDGLHKRGYRGDTGMAPLKENLAAAIVSLSGWNREVSENDTFFDPMCGSATLLIEAALMWGDSAPGLSRKYYGFSGWLGHDEKMWSKLVEEAITREDRGLERRWPRFIGFDADPEVVAVARKNIERAGLENVITVKCKEFAFVEPLGKTGFIVTNLPFGERLSEKNLVAQLYSCVGQRLRQFFPGWRAGIFISEPDFADKLNLQGSTHHKLYNGPIRCRLLTSVVASPEKRVVSWSLNPSVDMDDGRDFVNRLRKNLKRLQPWAKKNDIGCYRIYDKDLPDFNVAIDLYHKWVLVQEYTPPASIDAETSQKRFSAVLRGVRELLQVNKDRVFIKRRRRQKGNSQYRKKDVKPKFYQVQEGKCGFLVNFTNYLDTGLFLDHRPIRLKIAEMAEGKRFLNLFGYTGTATVHAARGGALRTVTVDLSSTYLHWAEQNLALNGFSERNHELVVQDCMSWLQSHTQHYDIIFVDPPTFSNTKKKKRIFDVQRDHLTLLESAAKVLAPGGIILFSTNYRGFRLDTALGQTFTVINISKETIPFDFKRNSAIHQCWQLTRS